MPIKGDFISFSYNGVHSTELGVVHVSTSDRYADSLLPTIQDKTVQVPGSDGTYFFGSFYTQQQFPLSVAFDNVSEDQIRLARRVFGDRQSHPLIFDEEPYKIYYAKITSTPQLNYVPFQNYDEDADTRPRIYKGEGTINFICYEPFAHTPNNYKYLNQWVVNGKYYAVSITEEQYTNHESNYYIIVEGQYVQCTDQMEYDSSTTYYIVGSGGPSWYKYDNKDEWNYSANLLSEKGTYDTFSNGSFKVYNPGDVEADFKFIIPISAIISGIKISDGTNDLESHTLNLKSPITAKGADTHLLFNSKTNLIEGLRQGARSMNLYNEYIQNGSWFKIPVNQPNKTWYFTPINYSGDNPTLEYDYLYF